MAPLLLLALACAPADADCGAGHYCRTAWSAATESCEPAGTCEALPDVPPLELWLPISSGETIFCAKGSLLPQGSHGACSDTGRFALDLATPASLAPHVILAAADGVAWPFGGCSTSDLDHGHTDRCNGGWGNVVHVEHENGLFTLYAHLVSILVAPGESVVRGQPLGIEGNTGAAGGKHLHFGLQRGDARIVGAGVSVPISRLVVDGATLAATELPCGDWAHDGTVHPETALRSVTTLVATPPVRYLSSAAVVTQPQEEQPPTSREKAIAFFAIAVVLISVASHALRRR